MRLFPAAVLASVSLACASAQSPAGPSPEPAPVLTGSGQASTAGAGPRSSAPDDRCVVTVQEVCSPLARDRGQCQVDDTRWARATYTGACGSEPAEWEIRPHPKTAWPSHEAQAFQWHHDSRIGYFRGECGDYLVRAHAPEADHPSEWLRVHLPAPFCDGR